MKTLTSLSRLLIVLSAIIILGTLFVPIWQIVMWAPQYPEGLEMKIWLDNITGDYKTISGLNHYIGMKHIAVDMFPEFTYMKYIVMGIVGLGLVTALMNRRAVLLAYVALLLTAGIAGMVDFYHWGYDYGHNLDPTAPIIVPGMAYQPPLIGTKQLLNFTAYSAPDIGGYLFLVAGLMAIGVLVHEWRHNKRDQMLNLAMLFSSFIMLSCAAKPEPIVFGKDGCYACKMTLMDRKFGGEVVLKTGKVYKFDDVNCMSGFLSSAEVAANKIQQILVIDFARPETLIDVSEAWFIKSEEVRSPMASNVAAFGAKPSLEEYNHKLKGSVMTWDDINK